jgi:hypothetical protein
MWGATTAQQVVSSPWLVVGPARRQSLYKVADCLASAWAAGVVAVLTAMFGTNNIDRSLWASN